MNPTLSLKATERMRASVADGDGDGSRMVNFDVSISIKNRLDAPDLIFDISAPEDAAVENACRQWVQKSVASRPLPCLPRYLPEQWWPKEEVCQWEPP